MGEQDRSRPDWRALAPTLLLAGLLIGPVVWRWLMGEEQYDPKCEGCNISRKRNKALERLPGNIVIDLPGDWTLNHYGSSEGFLGWLALQLRYHRMELNQLLPNEAAALGRNIQDIDIALRQYWSIHFKDPIQRVYVVYFFEGAFDEPKRELYHLHIHLIPRTKKFAHTLNKKKRGSEIVAWNIYTLREEMKKLCAFPSRYEVVGEDGKQNAERLMTYLSGFLWGLSGAKLMP